METTTLNAFSRQYVSTALWSSTDNADESGGEPLDARYTAEDIAPESLATMAAECASFREANESDLDEWNDDGQAGHDFWLTRNGHGAGFWDRDRGALGDRLTEAARAAGTSDLYVGDDGRLYVE